MSDKKSPFPAISRPSQNKGTVVHLNVALDYERLRKANQGKLPLPETYPAKTVLITQGTRQEEPRAAFVLQGEIHERQTHYSTTAGHHMHTVNIVRPGGVALVQALNLNHMSDPADVTLVAATDTTVAWITQDNVQLLKRGDLSADANLEARRQAQRSLVDLTVASGLALPFIKYAAHLRSVNVHEEKPEEIFRRFMKASLELPKARKQIEDLREQLKQMVATLEAKTQEADALRSEHDKLLTANNLSHVKIELMEKQVLQAQMQVGAVAQENFSLTQRHEAEVRMTCERVYEQYVSCSNLFLKIQGGLATRRISLESLGITERDRDVLRRTMPTADDLDEILGLSMGQEPGKEAKLGDTVPPEDIHEAPTPPPPDEVVFSRPFGSAPPVRLGPRTQELPELESTTSSVAEPSSKRAPISMPLKDKANVPPKPYRSKLPTFNLELDQDVKDQLRRDFEKIVQEPVGSTTARMPAMKPLPKPFKK